MHNVTTKKVLKIAARVASYIGMFGLGVLFCYGLMWYQVYQKFNWVWTCQVFVGELTIQEKAQCQDENLKSKYQTR